MDNNISQNNYAGFWIRWFASYVHFAVWSINFFLPLYLLSAYATSGINTFLPGLLWFFLYVFFISAFIAVLLHPYLISRLGGSLGKLICGLEILNDNGARLTFKNALFREYVAKMASNALLGVGYYWITKDPQKKGWHDSLAGTYVIKKHNGFITGFLALIVFIAIDAGLVYQSFNNFKNATTLQYDIATFVTQIQQDFEQMTPEAEEILDESNNNPLLRVQP